MGTRTSRSAKEYEALHASYLALRREVDHLSALREIWLAISGSLDLGETLTAIARVVQAELDVRRLTIFELSQDGGTAQPVIAKYGEDLIGRERLLEEVVPLRGTPLGKAVTSRLVILHTDAIASAAYVPLMAHGETLGVLRLEERRDGRPFTEDHAALFRLLSPHIGTAIRNARLYAMAVTDGLTGLYVRRYFDLRMAEELQQAQRYGRLFALLMFDIDHFKRLNDTYGHQTGDAVLKQFAALLRANTRKADICCRYGGEEMAVILPETRLEEAVGLGRKLNERVGTHPFRGAQEEELHVTVSVGVAAYGREITGAAEMIRAADEALYRAKHEGRDCVRWHDAARGGVT